MKKTLPFLVFILLSVTIVAANGYKITVKLTSACDSLICLAHYFDTNVYVNDTILTDQKGNGIFQADTLLPQGLYKIYLNNSHHFDFLLGKDQTLTIINSGFGLDDLQINGAEESREFLVYMKWLKIQQAKLSQLDSTLQKANESEKKEIRKEIEDLSLEVSHFWKETSGKYPGTFLASFLMSNYYEELKDDQIPKDFLANDSLKWIYQYNYRKNHYFDYFDLSDQRFLYTPLTKSKLDTYFDKVLLQMYDSVKPAAYQVLKKVESNPLMFRYVTSYLVNHSLNSRIMGMDALFVDIARDYYLSGKATWADSTTMALVRENVIFLENNLIGKQAPNLRMETFDGEPYFLCQGKTKYTILIFFEPGCSHCQEFVPKLYDEIYLPYHDKGLEIVAAYTMNDKKEWSDFLEKHNLNNWVNVWDQYNLSRFKIIYDTRTTPSVYLLDKDKKIIAKKFSIEFLKDYFGFYLGDNKEKQ
jgi:hypothetical protein